MDHPQVTEVLEASKNDGRGVRFYVDGQEIPAIVRDYDDHVIVGANQEFDRILIARSRVSAIAK